MTLTNSVSLLEEPGVQVNDFNVTLGTMKAPVNARVSLRRYFETSSCISTPLITATLCVIFIPTGIVSTMLGPMLPFLSKHWVLSDVQAGYLFTSQFAGSILGVMISGKAMWRGFRPVLVLGFVLLSCGVASLQTSSAALAFAGIFLYGVGLGLTIPSINLLVARIHSANASIPLNYLNLCWGLGAVACPFLIAMCQSRFHTVSPVQYGLAVTFVVFAIALAVITIPGSNSEKSTLADVKTRIEVWRSPFLSVLAGLFFLYVATENGVAGWIAFHAKRTEVSFGTLWTVIPGFFWGSLLLGRAIGHLLLRIVSELNAVRIHLLIAIAGIVVLVAAHNLPMIICASIVIGLGLSTVFPFYVNLLSERFGPGAPKAGAVLFALGGLGGACGPLAVGFIAGHYSLRVGFLLPLAGCAMMLVLCGPRRNWWDEFHLDVCPRANESGPIGNAAVSSGPDIFS
jgi:FHS family glucose/mannose:H+ symporter-like MFS transporter